MTRLASQQADAVELESAIYSGLVRHRRFTPTQHEFDYPLFMLLLKVDELPVLLRRFWQLGSSPWRWGRFRRADYLGDPQTPLDTAVKEKLAALSGEPLARLEGDVFMLAQLRYLGLYFSPLNLYYLRQDGRFRYMLAEVSNTPWNERHYYLVDLLNPQPHGKTFHVSPFNPMNQDYRWRIIPPDPERGKCLVHIQGSPGGKGDTPVFDAALMLERRPLNREELRRVLLKTPVQTLSILWGIYWQALRLFLKRTPLYRHPHKAKTNPGHLSPRDQEGPL